MVSEKDQKAAEAETQKAVDEHAGAAADLGMDEAQAKLDEEQEKGYRGEVPDHRDYTMRHAGVPPEDKED